MALVVYRIAVLALLMTIVMAAIPEPTAGQGAAVAFYLLSGIIAAFAMLGRRDSK